MKEKIKLNAALVIKHMSEKQLKQYKIQLEKEGSVPPPSVPIWFKEFYKEFKDFQKEMLDFKANQLKFNQEMLEFKTNQLKFNQYVLDVFKRNNLK